MTPVRVHVVGAATVVRDDVRAVPWREPRLDKFASSSARMLVSATARALGDEGVRAPGLVGVYLATGETGLDVDAFLAAARVAWNTHADDPDYRWLGGRALRAIDPYYSLRTLANGPAALLAMHLEATGPSLNVAHQRCGAAWALAAALDDLQQGRCDTAFVGACDVPSVPSRRAITRRLSTPPGRDGAAVLVLRRASEGARRHVRVTVRWDAAPAGEALTLPGDARLDGEPTPDGRNDDGVVGLLLALVDRGTASDWSAPFVVAMDAEWDGGVVVTVDV